MRRPPTSARIDDVISEATERLVAECIREAARQFVQPFADPSKRPEATEKSVGEVVTSVDLAVEAYLAECLPRIGPAVRVIGEEGASANTAILNGVDTKSYWLVDALDGTANFSAGGDDYATMVALVMVGTAVASWIFRPADDRLYSARTGMGARCNGDELVANAMRKPANRLVGDVLTRFLPESVKESVQVNSAKVKRVGGGTKCAGRDYPDVAEGTKDFVVYWRTLPWDHTPGVLILEEAGGVAVRPDRTPYTPSRTREGLVIARDKHTTDYVLTELLGI
jgi:fructose-1,6-bisphosphatase/inositol monophosphatase family enzyme